MSHQFLPADLLPGEKLLEGSLSLRVNVRDPKRFPFIAHVCELTNKHRWRLGVMFAYLRVRFPDMPVKNAAWAVRSLGPAGQYAHAVLTEMPLQDPAWCAQAGMLLPTHLYSDKRPPWLPVGERVFLAWLENRIPQELLTVSAFADAVNERPRKRSESGASWRKLFY